MGSGIIIMVASRAAGIPMKNTVLVYEAEPDEGGYWASVAELPGCTTSGETIEEIEENEENVRDAIEAYLDALEQTGQPMPKAATRKLEVVVA
jgi:predicted RNase H-like HicB family nuclease